MEILIVPTSSISRRQCLKATRFAAPRRALNRALAGGTIVRFESVYPAVMRVADKLPVIGRTVESVSARGKHLLITFSGGLVLHTHMRMNGSWHLYRPGIHWQRPAR